MRKETNKGIGQWILGATGLMMGNLLHAGIPVWTYSAPSPASVTVSDGGTTTVQYTVTNQSLKSKNLILKTTPGMSASACHLAGKGSTCLLTLTVKGSGVPKQGIHAGPVLCEQNNPNQCYQPSTTNVLHVVKSSTPPPLATIGVTPSTLSLIAGGLAQAVTVSNDSATAVENIQASIPGTSAITIDAGNTTCTNILAGNSTCLYSFQPGTQTEVNTVITINGSNTTESATVAAHVSEVTISLSAAALTIPVGSSGTIVVKNESASPAVSNLQVNNLPSGIEIDNAASTCIIGDSLPGGDTCSLVFTASTATGSTVVIVKGDNTNDAPLTLSATSTTISVTPQAAPPLILNADGVAEQVFIVANTGAEVAVNIGATAVATTDWVGVSMEPSAECTELAPGGNNCTITVSSSTPNVAGYLTVQGSNTDAVNTDYIAFRAGGGLVFSVSGGITKVVTEMNITSSPAIWGGYFYEVGGINENSTVLDGAPCDGKNDGACNTARIVKCLSDEGSGVGTCTGTPTGYPIIINTYAAGLCNQYDDGSNTNWYLPAICEWSNSIYGCSINNIYINLRQHGFGDIAVDDYWSSTESAVSPLQVAWYQIFAPSNSSSQDFTAKLFSNGVRCVRGF